MKAMKCLMMGIAVSVLAVCASLAYAADDVYFNTPHDMYVYSYDSGNARHMWDGMTIVNDTGGGPIILGGTAYDEARVRIWNIGSGTDYGFDLQVSQSAGPSSLLFEGFKDEAIFTVPTSDSDFWAGPPFGNTLDTKAVYNFNLMMSEDTGQPYIGGPDFFINPTNRIRFTNPGLDYAVFENDIGGGAIHWNIYSSGGAVPEPVTVFGFIAGIFMLGFKRLLKRK